MNALPALDSVQIHEFAHNDCQHWLLYKWLNKENRPHPTQVDLIILNDESWRIVEALQEDLKHLAFGSNVQRAPPTPPGSPLTRLKLELRWCKWDTHHTAHDIGYPEAFAALVQSSLTTLRTLTTCSNSIDNFSAFANLQHLSLTIFRADEEPVLLAR
ncbi:hypothetical protein JCM8547_002042 [Rhodosporidiobolus lusitaniae]